MVNRWLITIGLLACVSMLAGQVPDRSPQTPAFKGAKQLSGSQKKSLSAIDIFDQTRFSIVRVVSEGFAGTGFFGIVAGRLVIITARHVLGNSVFFPKVGDARLVDVKGYWALENVDVAFLDVPREFIRGSVRLCSF